MLKIVSEIIANQRAATTPISALREVEYPELDALMQEFATIPEGEDHIKVITASNHDTAKASFIEAFRAGQKPESPKFEYDEGLLARVTLGKEPLVRIYDAALAMPALSDEQKLLKYLFATTVKDKLSTIGIAEGIQRRNDQYTLHHVEQKYGRLTDDVIDAAREEYELVKDGKKATAAPRVFTFKEEETLKAMRFDAKGIAKIMRDGLAAYGFTNWTSGVYENVSAVNVREREIDIAIPSSRNCDGKKAFELEGHENEAHVRQSMNGQFVLRGLGGGIFKDESEILYEGLALVNDVNWDLKFGDTTRAPIPYYALAGELAMMGKNFLEIYEEVFQLRIDTGASTKDKKDGGPAPIFNNTWTNTYRVMRASVDATIDNSIGFCMPKDKAYLEGYRIARELVENGYGHLLDVGVVRPSSLAQIAKYIVKSDDIPYRDLGIAEKLAREALGA